MGIHRGPRKVIGICYDSIKVTLWGKRYAAGERYFVVFPALTKFLTTNFLSIGDYVIMGVSAQEFVSESEVLER